ncbi:uncharacterized protein LOC119489809 isoform X2 [Sebastes umbrosus]|uniref:uncharacterized protein LOC119489809 isoform X1 n=1 Tax=Sebastes umbrosus TaxID=72105 RepID=UPI0018A01911|nr:uncharacterized protein LOC119489809 isoform X1 [Sebastes umbrosus]XP_037628625.1 uncharacterized protein LOC119489809 isoform X2 [Sebastes umbrosus]
MENPCVELFISSLAQSLNPGCPELISRLSFSECRKEMESLLIDRCDAQTASKDSLLKCLLLIFHRQTSLAIQSKAALEKEVDSLRTQSASLLHEVQTADKKAMRYLEDLHSAELVFFQYKEKLLGLRLECLSPPQSVSHCDSGYSDSLSSRDESLTPSPLRSERFPTDLKSLGMKSDPQPPLRERVNSYLTTYCSETDSEDTCSLSSRRYPATCSSQPQRNDTFLCAPPSKSSVCSASFPLCHKGDDSCPASASQPERTLACDAPVHCNANLVLPSAERTPQGPRHEVLEFIAKDIECFDPGNCDQHIDDYFKELDHNLIDLKHATQREKVKLVWKTSSQAVHKFIQSQPLSVRNDYGKLRHALIEEFSSTADETSAMFAALQIKHSRSENPRDYYKRLRHAYFQGKNAPGLEENAFFKSLFLQNLHPCVRTQVVLRTQEGNPSLCEIRKMTQIAWETLVISKKGGKLTEPTSSNTDVSSRSATSKAHLHNRSKGGQKRRHKDTERNRHVPHLHRDRHSHNRSVRKPYAEILSQNWRDRSDDDLSISDHISDSEQGSEHGHNLAYSDSYSECLSASGYLELPSHGTSYT